MWKEGGREGLVVSFVGEFAACGDTLLAGGRMREGWREGGEGRGMWSAQQRCREGGNEGGREEEEAVEEGQEKEERDVNDRWNKVVRGREGASERAREGGRDDSACECLCVDAKNCK